MGYCQDKDLRVQFDRRSKVKFLGSQVTTDAGLLAYRELDETLGLTEMATDALEDSRVGSNKQHGLLPLLRQSIYSRLAGYEDVNDAERLSIDPAMRHVGKSAKIPINHTKLMSFELDLAVESTIWVILFMRIIGALQYGTDQKNVQRLHSAKSPRLMIKSMMGSYVALVLFSCISIPASWGFVAFYAKHPELRASIVHPDQVLPDFALRFLPPVFRSLIMAGVLAALMSSLDSALNSMSSVTVSDFYRRYVNREASDKQLVKVAKLLTAAFGLLMLGFGLWQVDRQGDVALEKYMKLFNVVATPMTAFFILGMFSRRVNTAGAVIGAVAGVSFAIVFNGIPGIIEKQLDWINWMWVAGLATIVNIAVGYAASYLFPAPPPKSLEGTTFWRESSKFIDAR